MFCGVAISSCELLVKCNEPPEKSVGFVIYAAPLFNVAFRISILLLLLVPLLKKRTF